MARYLRDLTRSTWYHVFNRGADRQDIFSCEADYVLFERLLAAEVVERFGIEVHAYALMSNHFHLLLHCPDPTLSEAMQRLCGRFGSAYNQRAHREGPVLTGRFKSVPIESDGQLTQVARYIHRNPLAIVPVSALDKYRWSSLGALIGVRDCPDWLSTGIVVGAEDDRGQYLSYVVSPQTSDKSGGVPPAFTWSQIEQVIRTIGNVSAGEILIPTRGRANPLRTLAITLAVEYRAATVDELARWSGVDVQSIRRTARQGRVAVATSNSFEQLRRNAVAELHGDRAA